MLDHYDESGTLTLARRWSSATGVGDQVQFTKPRGNFVLRHDVPYHVFTGEEAASVAFAAMLRSLPATAELYGVVEAASAADHLPLERSLHRGERRDASAQDSAVLADAVRALQLPEHPVCLPGR